MSGPGDAVRVGVAVRVDAERAFRVFTEQIDAWWKRGFRFRNGGSGPSVIALEARLGGRLFETLGDGAAARVVETGRVTVWDPPHRLVIEWRAINFTPDERTEIEVRFEPRGATTWVEIEHRGWGAIRDDHPVRHGLAMGDFVRMMGGFWGELATSLRIHASAGD